MRLIRGAPGSGKTALIFREFKAAGCQGRIVVPTATLVRHFQHELARSGVVFKPGAVVSLNKFIADLASPHKPAPEGLLRLIVRQTLRRTNLPEFAQVAATPGMADAVFETIGLFETAGCTPEKLSAVRKLSPGARGFARLWREIAADLSARGYLSHAGLVRAAVPKERGGPVWMDGFVNIGPIERELVRALTGYCDLTVTVTDGPAGDEIRRMALQCGASEKLLSGAARRAPVTIIAAQSMEREADEIARRILELNRAGLEFREMAVAVRDTEAYLPLLRSCFEGFGIPARFYLNDELKAQPAARFFSGLIRCVLEGWDFGAALDALRAHPKWGVTAASDRFDFEVRERMPNRGVEALAAISDAPELRLCFDLDRWRNGTLSPAEWARRMRAFLEAAYRPGLLEPAPDFTAVRAARMHAAGVRALVEAIDHTAEYLGAKEGAVTLEDFWGIASDAIESATLRVYDDRYNAVSVMSAFEARQWDVSTLFACGVTDRDYPRRNSRNALFSDSEIDALHKAGIPLRKAADRDEEEIGLFESLKTRARDSLVLTWPARNAAGAGAEPSRLLNELGVAAVAPVPCRATPLRCPPVAGSTGVLQSPALLSGIAVRHQTIGLTALEDMVQCRFKFFAAKTLGLRGRPERPRERLQPRLNGLILHKALEVWLNEGRQGAFVDAFETAFEEMCAERNLPPGYNLEMERIFLRAIARTAAAAEKWTALSSEAEVPLSLKFPGGITVNCRVDRIDRLNERDCVIVDYKSGRTKNVESLIHSPAKLQGPLYALAVREGLGLNTAAMMYIAVRDDKPFGWGGVPGIDLGLQPIPPRWMEDARDRAAGRLASFLGGAIHPDPAEAAKCRWCEFAHACRYAAEEVKTEAARGA